MLKKSHTKGDKGDMEVEAAQASHEELRIKLTNIQTEYQQEKAKLISHNKRLINLLTKNAPGQIATFIESPNFRDPVNICILITCGDEQLASTLGLVNKLEREAPGNKTRARPGSA
ncbi:hypothetical protein JRQ81_016167 [Phrynocephalus forsythii]|uniref:Uncharacterized protein n=1 Tax=Phrynocephalus forsythii TaxID=171643 RepID=A0A9Q0XVB8_9SAUR|nr:hypothetical protein JRQ81_016167 [Phrynocephalus forsythii]